MCVPPCLRIYEVQYIHLEIMYQEGRWEAASEQYMVQRDATGLDRKSYIQWIPGSQI